MKKKGLKEATQTYHVSSSPIHDTLLETPTNSTIPSPVGFVHSAAPAGHQDDTNHSHFRVAAQFAELPSQTPRVNPDRLSPRVELVLGPPIAGHSNGGSSKWRDRTADWVEMVERSGLRGGGGGDAGAGNSYHRNPNFRRTSSFNDPKPQLPSTAHSRRFRERSMTQVIADTTYTSFCEGFSQIDKHFPSQVGSWTLPEGSCWSKGGRERQPYYSIPEHGTPEWSKSRLQRNDQSMTLQHTRTSTNQTSGHEDMRSSSGLTGGRVVGGVSGIGGPSTEAAGPQGMKQLSMDRAEMAEWNWNRRGPSPIQRNILARKLKEAQSSSGVRGRQRSSTFSVSSSEQRKGRCCSLPMSGGHSSSDISPYRLSEAEQRMLDLDLSSVYAGQED